MSSMAATLAGLQPAQNAASAAAAAQQQQQQQAAARRAGAQGAGHIPARYEEALDVEGELPINDVELNGTALLKILKHSTDPSPIAASHAAAQHHRNDRESTFSPTDAMGLLLGLDLSGTAEVADCFALPTGLGTSGVSALLDGDKSETSYAPTVLRHLREVSILDNPIGVYLTTHSPTLFSTLTDPSFNPSQSSQAGGKDVGGVGGMLGGSGWLIRNVVEAMAGVEKLAGARGTGVTSTGKQGGGGRAVLIVHDASRGASGDVQIRAYKFSEGFAAALRKQRFDTASLIEHRLTPTTMLTPLPLRTKSPALLNALFSTLSMPTEPSSSSASCIATLTTSSALGGPSATLLPFQTSSSTTLPTTLSNTLASLANLSQEQNALAYQMRQVAREKSRYEQAAQARQDENDVRKKQGLTPLPDVPEPVAKRIQDPSRLDLLMCLGAVDNAAKGLAAEAGKGLVKSFASA
ncbi:hypothetical protein QFC19_007324 [Naganishia cerealis]|uniref:Uncharacterized protein n=1 Tax=Naganishia cerealis TaxID=610337 RepID=A0ACC2V9N6_9TREE|nr:hypothetical protein QFC19_007324 [Naganishia cerealis]